MLAKHHLINRANYLKREVDMINSGHINREKLLDLLKKNIEENQELLRFTYQYSDTYKFGNENPIVYLEKIDELECMKIIILDSMNDDNITNHSVINFVFPNYHTNSSEDSKARSSYATLPYKLSNIQDFQINIDVVYKVEIYLIPKNVNKH